LAEKKYILPLLLSAGAIALFATSAKEETQINNNMQKLPSGGLE